MFRFRRESYKCPECGTVLSEVRNVEVTVSKFDIVLAVCMGLGFGLFAGAAWYVTWWGALGVALMAGVLTFLIQASTKRRRMRKKEEGGDDA